MSNNVEKIAKKHIDHAEWLGDTKKPKRVKNSEETRYYDPQKLIIYHKQKTFNF